jgi:outer membrane protein
MDRFLYLSIIITSLFFSSPAWSESEYNQQTLQNLLKSQQPQAAYDYASKYLAQMEGDPYFDYVYGVSAIDTGHASQGVFALERVLLSFPEDHVARLELARGYFILEEFARARQEFEIVLKTSPPKGVITISQTFLDKIRLKEARYRTTSNGFIEFSMGTDNNVNSGVDRDALILITTLTEESLSQDDNFTSITGAWQFTHPFAPGWMFNSAITGHFRANQDFDQFNSATATLQLGFTKIEKDSRYKLGILGQQFNLDSNKYRTLSGLNFDWDYALSQKSKFTTSFQFATLDYPDQTIRNSDLLTMTIGYSYSFSTLFSPYFFSSLTVGSENAEQAPDPDALSDTERDLLGIKAGVILSFTPKLALKTSVGIQNSSYGGEQTHPSFPNTTREDDYLTADMSLLWLFENKWRLDTKISYTQNDSNVEIYNYDRTLISLNANYAF